MTEPDQSPDLSDRFDFGGNWSNYLQHVTPERRRVAEASLTEMLGPRALDGKRFLDAGSGSGLFSLAAADLGAEVVSGDLDPSCVACALQLRESFHPETEDWKIRQLDLTDSRSLEELGEFDIVYSWGVLHHTGSMWGALENVCGSVRPGGTLFVALYNDQGLKSRLWKLVKRTHQRIPEPLKIPYAVLVMLPRELNSLAFSILGDGGRSYLHSWTRYASARGMSRWHDLIDWVGGYPFEVSRPDQVFEFCRARGFTLRELRTTGGGIGCNQFVFERSAD